MIGGYAKDIKRSNTTYFGIYWPSFSENATTTEAETYTYVPFNCIVSNFYVYLSANAGPVGSSYTFRIRQNNINTSVSVIISGATNLGSDITNSVSFTSGDILTVSAVPSSPTQPTDNLDVRWSCRLTGV